MEFSKSMMTISGKPVAHATRDALYVAAVKVDYVKRTYAPAVVVAVLPVVHAVFPPSFVGTPPFSRHIIILQSPAGGFQCVGFPALIIHMIRRHAKVERTSQCYATDDDGSCGIMSGRTACRCKINAVSSIISSAYAPDAYIPSPVASPVRARYDGFGCVIGGTVKEGQSR